MSPGDERRKLARPERQKGSPWDAWLHQGRLTEGATFELGPKGGPGLFQVKMQEGKACPGRRNRMCTVARPGNCEQNGHWDGGLTVGAQKGRKGLVVHEKRKV